MEYGYDVKCFNERIRTIIMQKCFAFGASEDICVDTFLNCPSGMLYGAQ